METATLFTLANISGLRAGAVRVCLFNIQLTMKLEVFALFRSRRRTFLIVLLPKNLAPIVATR